MVRLYGAPAAHAPCNRRSILGTTGPKTPARYEIAPFRQRQSFIEGVGLDRVANGESKSPTQQLREAQLARLQAENEVLRLEVERREAALAVSFTPTTVPDLLARAARAAIQGLDRWPDPDIPTRACSRCHSVKWVGDFYASHAGGPAARVYYHHTCKQCLADDALLRESELADVRKRLERITSEALTCSRCGLKKPSILFRDGERTCLPCKVEVLEEQNTALRERVPVGIEWRREVARRRRHGNPEKYARRQIHREMLILAQADGTLTREVVGQLFAEAEGKPCPYCGKKMDRETKSLDHIVPVSKGGLHSLANVLICCLRCNTAKGNRDFAVWLSRLEEPYASIARAEYVNRYRAEPAQSVLPFQFSVQ